MNKLRTILTWGLLLAATHVMGYTITVSPTQIEAGQSTNLIINLNNTETNLTAYQMKIFLPTGVTVQKKANGKYAYTSNADRLDPDLFTVTVKDAADGSVLIAVFSPDKDVIAGTSGELIRLPIDVASTVTTSLHGSLKEIEFTDVNNQAYNISDVNFTLTMQGSGTPDPGVVTGDVTVSIPDVAITAGSSTNLIINMQTGLTNLTAYQMKLYLPTGVTVQKKANGKYAYMSNADRLDPDLFTITVKDAVDGSVLIAVFSPDKDVIAGTSGELIRLPIDVASTVTTSLQGSLKEIEFTDVNNQAYNISDVNFTMTLGGETSSNITFADPAVKAICVANWDTNGDGELSEAEAAAVTDLGEVFKSDTTITSFDELQYFTGLTSLQDNAFNGCTNLTSFIIPRNVTSIGGDTFRDCKNLISISVADGNTNYDSRDNCNAIIEIATNKLLLGCTNTNIPMGVTSIGVRAFQWCRFTSIDIPNSVSSIEEDAFSWCPNLTSFIIPEGVTTIAPITFYQCTSLTTITIPSSLKNVKTGAFRDCSSLSKVIVPDIAAWCGIIYEGDDWNGDFPLGRAHHLYSDENTEITEVVIPEGVTRIEARVFRDAEYVTSVTLPNSLTYIDQEAFRGMRHLTSINIPSSVTVIGKSAFTDCDILQKVIVPDIAAWCQTFFGDGWGNPLYSSHHIFSDETTEIKDLIIPEGVTKISHFAFFGCSGLTSVTIPNSITQLNKSTFCYCHGLKSVTLPSCITSIGDYVFAYCSSLTDVWCYAENVPTTGSNAFNNSPIATATLHIPIASLESYKATSPWSGFGTIVPIEEAGIEVTDISQLDNAIYIEPFSTRSGKTVNMDIRLKNNQDIAAYSFNLVLPEGVTLAKNTKDKYIYTLAEDRHDEHSCTINEQNGTYSIAVLSISGGEISGNDGTVITLQLIMDESMEEGDYPIQIMNSMYSLPNGQTINVPETRTALTIENILVGDVNDNKTIDIGDAVCIVNYIVGKPNAVFVEKAADVNGNGTAGEIGDAVSVVNIIVGKTIMQMPKAIRTNILDPQ